MINTVSVTKSNDRLSYSPIRYFGGKANLAEEIINLIPEHRTYVEVFAGGCHVLTRKTISPVEIINDIDSSLVNFLMVLRHQKEELIQELSKLPTSRYLFEKWAKEPFPNNDFEHALRWFYLLRQRIVPANNQIQTLGWRTGRFKNSASDYQNAINRLTFFENRMKSVMIECKDFEEIIRMYDSKETFFFIDPPYRGREKFYKGGFQHSDHIRLARCLHNIKGKALLTHIEDPVYNGLYANWSQHRIKNLAHKGVIKAELGQTKTVQTEVIFMNYTANNQQQLF